MNDLPMEEVSYPWSKLGALGMAFGWIQPSPCRKHPPEEEDLCLGFATRPVAGSRFDSSHPMSNFSRQKPRALAT